MLIQKTIISHRVFHKIFTVLAAMTLMFGVVAACGGDSDTATEETVPVVSASEPYLPNSSDESAPSVDQEQVVQSETNDPAEPADPSESADPSGQSDQPEEADQPEAPVVNASDPAPSSTLADQFGATIGEAIGDLNQVVEELINGENEIETADIVVAVQDGEIVLGESRYEVDLGENISIEVSSSQFDREVHVHGYDLTAFSGPITPARFEFVADLAGTWEVEFEDTHELIFELVVS